MKKTLRYLFLLLLAVVWGGNGFAQTAVTFDATQDKGSTATTLTKDGVTLTLSGGGSAGSGSLSNGTDYRCYKSATFTVSSTKNIAKIELTCTASGTTKYGPGCFGKLAGYVYSGTTGTWTGESSEVSLTASSNQVRMTKVVVTLAASKTLTSLAISGDAAKKEYNDGEEFDPTGLVVTGTYDDNTTATITSGITWTKTPATLAAGNTSCSVTATVDGVTSAAYEVSGLTVTKNVVLSIDPATSTVVKAPVTVTLTANAGATIYYTTNGDEPSTSSTKYDAPFEVTTSGTTVKAIAVAEGAEDATAEATYTIQPEQPWFSDVSKTFKEAFDVTLSLPASTDESSKIYYAIGATATAESTPYEGPITISSDNEGEKIILHAVVVDQYGNVGSEKFCTYTKTNEHLFNFNGSWEGITPASKNDIKTDADNANVVAGKELNVDGIVMTATNGSSSTTCLYGSTSDHELRVYTGGTITFTAPKGYNIVNISFTGGTSKLSASEGTFKSGIWDGDAHAVTFTASGTNKISSATIQLAAATLSTLTLSETDADVETTIAENDGKVVNVKLQRTLKANVWNTICLPFAVDADDVKNVLKAEGNVKEYESEDEATATINFKDATALEAGVPYLIKPTEGATELNFEFVTIKNVEDVERMVGENYNIIGTFAPYKMDTKGTELFLQASGKFAVPAVGKNTMNGFRAYFLVPSGTSAANVNINFGEATGISGVEAEAVKAAKVYNLSGQYVGTSLEALPKGIYVVGGKKVLK